MRTPVGVAMSALVALASIQAFAPRETPPLAASQLPVQRMHVNTLAQSKAALLAGGELGHLIFSRDEGKTWLPAGLPNDRQALINQISIARNGLDGVAVGHEGWILRTSDGGLSWREVAFAEKNGEPLMSVAQLPSGAWIAVGAFGRALISDIRGEQWSRLNLPAEVEDKHLNRVVSSSDGRSWLIVGERGLVLRSEDGGNVWTVLPPFYKGSFYNAVQLKDGAWLVYGMRGNAFRSADGVSTWERANISAAASFFGHSLAADGLLTLVGQGSLMATSSDGGRNFELTRAAGRATLTDVLQRSDGGWIASDAGLQPLPAHSASTTANPAQNDTTGARR